MIERSCDELVSELLAQAGEGNTVDYKAAMPWPPKGTDERARLIRHMIGFGNARDGGYLLIGVDDETKRPTGLTDEQAKSWDPSNVAEALTQFSAPPPRLKICQGRAPTNELLVALHIAEFAELPTVCIQDHVSKSPSSPDRMVLRRGALYIRDGASTREVDSEPLMRELLRRAYVKTAQALLQQIKELIDAHWPGAAPSDEAEYQQEIDSALNEIRWP